MEKILEKNNYEPKRENRFQVVFPKEIPIPLYIVKSITKPLFKGKRWGVMTIELYDPIGPSTSQTIHELITTPDDREDYFENPLFTFHIESLDPTGVVIEKWEVDVAYIISVDFGKLDNRNDTTNVVTIDLKPANCVLLF